MIFTDTTDLIYEYNDYDKDVALTPYVDVIDARQNGTTEKNQYLYDGLGRLKQLKQYFLDDGTPKVYTLENYYNSTGTLEKVKDSQLWERKILEKP